MQGMTESACRVCKAWPVVLLLLSITTMPGGVQARENQAAALERDTLIAAAREIMTAARYCALITIDSNGQPQARTMDPFPPEEDMIVWFGTNPKSRKVQEISGDPRVTLYYADPDGGGYVVIAGTARLVDDPTEKARRWKEGWEAFYPDREDSYLLIAVAPRQFDLLSYRHGITGDPVTWKTPTLEFKAPESKD